MRILAVDDSVSIRELVRLVLKATDGVALVETAESAEQALALIQAQVFDLLIVDWYMQPRSGADLLKEFKSNSKYSAIPVIVLSADQDPQAKAEAKSLGAVGWMTKPFNPKRLQELVLSYKVG
jgi:two-component system chemotaxis response regulator CheY